MQRLMVLAVALLLAGCGGATAPGVDPPAAELTIAISPLIVQGGPAGDFMAFDSVTQIQLDAATRTAVDGATSAHINRLVLSIDSPVGDTFDFTNAIRAQVAKHAVGQQVGIAKKVATVDLTPSNVNVIDALALPAATLTVSLLGFWPVHPVSVSGSMTIVVD